MENSESSLSATSSVIPKWVMANLRWGKTCCWLSCIALVLTELAGSHWPAVLFTPYIPQLAAIAFIGLFLLWLVGLRKYRKYSQMRYSIVIGVVAMAYAFCIRNNLIPDRVVESASFSSADSHSFTQVKVLSANVHTSNSDHKKILDLIEAEKPEIILLMELSSTWTTDLKSLNEKYQFHRSVADDSGNFGIGFWTKLNAFSGDLVLLKQEEPGSLHDVPQVEALLEYKDQSGQIRRIHFIGLHPLPPMVPGMAGARDAVLNGVIKSVAKDKQTPTIVAGDFNATRYCRIVQRLSWQTGLKDAASHLRFSWPNTWSWWAMGIRIDHVLVSDHWRVVETKLGNDIGSDHLPIISSLELIK